MNSPRGNTFQGMEISEYNRLFQCLVKKGKLSGTERFLIAESPWNDCFTSSTVTNSHPSTGLMLVLIKKWNNGILRSPDLHWKNDSSTQQRLQLLSANSKEESCPGTQRALTFENANDRDWLYSFIDKKDSTPVQSCGRSVVPPSCVRDEILYRSAESSPKYL